MFRLLVFLLPVIWFSGIVSASDKDHPNAYCSRLFELMAVDHAKMGESYVFLLSDKNRRLARFVGNFLEEANQRPLKKANLTPLTEDSGLFESLGFAGHAEKINRIIAEVEEAGGSVFVGKTDTIFTFDVDWSPILIINDSPVQSRERLLHVHRHYNRFLFWFKVKGMLGEQQISGEELQKVTFSLIGTPEGQFISESLVAAQDRLEEVRGIREDILRLDNAETAVLAEQSIQRAYHPYLAGWQTARNLGIMLGHQKSTADRNGDIEPLVEYTNTYRRYMLHGILSFSQRYRRYLADQHGLLSVRTTERKQFTTGLFHRDRASLLAENALKQSDINFEPYREVFTAREWEDLERDLSQVFGGKAN